MILLTGFLLGLRHALDPDHVTAVTHFISIEPDPKRGVWFGFRWALGHGITVFTLGTLVILMDLKLSSGFERSAQIAVGVTLVGLAIWRLWLLREGKTHRHPHRHDGSSHAHPHGHDPASGHVHPYAPTWVGMLHGAAGSLAVFLLIPVSFMVSRWLAYLYMGIFSLGCLISMTFYGRLAGSVYQSAAVSKKESLFSGLVFGTSLVGLFLGIFWIARGMGHA